jgi:aryl sulfotransferase
MKILQGGYPKSGNYWLYKIISEILQETGIEKKSFIRNQPIYQLARDWQLSYPEQADVDMLEILYTGVFYRISSRYKEKLERPELVEYAKNSTHVWTHSNYCQRSKDVFPLFDKLIYIIRDPRDIVVSSAKFAFTPYMQKHYPTLYKNPKDFLNGEIENISKAWAIHVKEYLEFAADNNLYIIFYERFLQNFDVELTKLLDYLNIKLKPSQKERIKNSVSFNSMKKDSPGHVRKAKLYDWMDVLSEEQEAFVLENARPVLRFLGYPTTLEEENQLPDLPRLSKRKINALKEEMDGKSLLEQLRGMIEEVRS